MANINKDGYIKLTDGNGNIITVYPYTKAENVDGLNVFGASGSNHSTGLVPDPGATAGTSKYLREDGTWAEPAGGGGGGTVTGVKVGTTSYSPDSAGMVSIPAYPDVSGKIDTAGTGLSKSGTTLNHSNSVTAKTTAGAYKIKYDSSGHITGISSLSYSDIDAASSDHTHDSAYVQSPSYFGQKSSGSLNDINTSCVVYCSSGVTNVPYSNAAQMVETYYYNSSTALQRSTIFTDNVRSHVVYIREKRNGSWTDWRLQGYAYKDYAISLNSLTWSKSSAGLYYSTYDISSDWKEPMCVSICGWASLPNYVIMPILVPLSPVKIELGCCVPDGTAPSFTSNSRVTIRVAGYIK